MTYRVNLTGKSDLVEYLDEGDQYELPADLDGKEWSLNLVGWKNGDDHELSEEEERVIVPRVSAYLEKIKWFGLFGGNYRVKVVRVFPPTREEIIQQERERGNTVVENPDGSFTVFPKKRKSFFRRLWRKDT